MEKGQRRGRRQGVRLAELSISRGRLPGTSLDPSGGRGARQAGRQGGGWGSEAAAREREWGRSRPTGFRQGQSVCARTLPPMSAFEADAFQIASVIVQDLQVNFKFSLRSRNLL